MTTDPRRIAGGIARAVAFLVLVFLIEAVLVIVLGAPIAWLITTSGNSQMVNSMVLVVSALAATTIMLRSIDVRSWSDVGLAREGVRPRAIIEGWFLGGAAIGLACAALLAAGWLRIEPSPAGSSLAAAARISLFLVPAALGEELVCRGYLLTTFRDGVGVWRAVAITSLLFGLAHLFNQGVTAESFLNVTLAGVFLAAIRVLFDSLYAAWAAHAAWNWVMAVPLHAPVSGLSLDAPDYHTVSHGPAWLTGGPWGPEGGIAAALGMLAGLAYLHRTRRRREES
ncbi:MAG TPA: type II CAAX endopeptidase family protein [Gemmatimonadaceae bacterium]|nr:type II CAAX endopeptidase family protein [Gemmatimonadaceae bacterium]